MLGIRSKLYVNDGTYNSPDWVEINHVADATLNDAWDEGVADARDSLLHQFEQTMKSLSLDGRIRVNPDDDGYAVIRDANVYSRQLDVMVLNGPLDENGAHGYRFFAKVFGFNEGQNLTEVIYKDFSLKPNPGDETPKYVLVAGGAPTFHELGQDGS